MGSEGWVTRNVSYLPVGLLLATCLWVAACTPLAGPLDADASCLRAANLESIDREWLTHEVTYQAVFQTMQETRSLPTRRQIEAMTTCFRPGDDLWNWRRTTWVEQGNDTYVATNEIGFALVRDGAVLGGVLIAQRPGTQQAR